MSFGILGADAWPHTDIALTATWIFSFPNRVRLKLTKLSVCSTLLILDSSILISLVTPGKISIIWDTNYGKSFDATVVAFTVIATM